MASGESKGVLNKQKIFIPLTIDKRFWNKDMPNVFLNKVYEAQIEPEDNEIQYTTLQTYYTYAKDEKFQDFCSRLIVALGEVLNQYHGLNESNRFWRAMLWLWVQEYAASIKFKIEQFNNLQKAYPPEKYIYCSYARKHEDPYQFLSRNDPRYVVADEEYHFATYSWMAENFFDFHIEKKVVQKADKNEQKKEIEPKIVTSLIYTILRDVFLEVRKIALFSLKIIAPSQARVGLWHAATGSLGGIRWFLKSHGAIQEISIPIAQHDYKIDDLFRKALPKILKDKTSAHEEEQLILDFLPYALPSFFIEKFKKQYNAANDYLSKHKNMVVIFTLTSMLESSAGKICELLLQKRGGKVIGQQHGGDYQVTPTVDVKLREREWNDAFYYWGKGALAYRSDEFPTCKISYGPSSKFDRRSFIFLRGWVKLAEKLFSKGADTAKWFLFVGTSVDSYPKYYTYGNLDNEKEEYIQCKLQFLSLLSNDSRAKIIVREYPTDYGWHMSKKIKAKFPKLRISNGESFDKMLSGCSLYIADHLATTWLEAIYFGKPLIVLLPDHEISIHNATIYRKEEKEYIEMLENIGVIIHSPKEAAKLVNFLAEHGVTEWWMDEERQRVMRLVRERWTTKIKDEEMDAWWYRELMTQAELVESGR